MQKNETANQRIFNTDELLDLANEHINEALEGLSELRKVGEVVENIRDSIISLRTIVSVFEKSEDLTQKSEDLTQKTFPFDKLSLGGVSFVLYKILVEDTLENGEKGLTYEDLQSMSGSPRAAIAHKIQVFEGVGLIKRVVGRRPSRFIATSEGIEAFGSSKDSGNNNAT